MIVQKRIVLLELAESGKDYFAYPYIRRGGG